MDLWTCGAMDLRSYGRKSYINKDFKKLAEKLPKFSIFLPVNINFVFLFYKCLIINRIKLKIITFFYKKHTFVLKKNVSLLHKQTQ